MTNAAQEQWLATAAGRKVDIDGVGGYQCVDVAKDYGQAIFGVDWRTLWPGAGNACDMLYTYSATYFDRIFNDASNTALIPVRGDILIYDGTAVDGVNPYGHIGVVVNADQNGVDLMDQDGFLQRAMLVERLAYTNYGTGPCSGWLRPKVSSISSQATTVTPITPQEEDMPLSDDDIKRIWAGPGAWILNRRTGKQEYAETLVGSNEDRIQNEIVGPQFAALSAKIDALAAVAAKGANVDPAALKQTVEDAVKASFGSYTVSIQKDAPTS